MQETATTMIDLSDRGDAPSLDELREKCRRRLVEKFAGSLEDVTDGLLGLALGAEKEDVRFRAQKRILDEFSQGDRGKLQNVPNTTIQILNNIPIDRTAYIGKSEAETFELNGTKFATPVMARRKVEPVPEKKFSSGSRMISTQSLPGSMPDIGTPTDNDPERVTVPTLPDRKKA